MTTKWIGPDEHLSLGDVGFLIKFESNRNGGSERWELRETPAQTNQSNAPRLTGWCGTFNDLSTNAHGMGKVIRVAKNHRCLIKELENVELEASLELLGYPELFDGERTEVWEAWLDGKEDEAVQFRAPIGGTYDIRSAGADALGIDVCENLNVARVEVGAEA